MGFSRQEYCSGLLCPPPGDLPDLGVEPASLRSNLHWQVVSLPLVHTWEAPLCIITYSLLADMKLTQEHIFSWLLWGCQSWLKVSQYTTVNTVVNLSPQTTKKKPSYISASMSEKQMAGVDNVSGPFQREDFVSPSLDKQEKLDLNPSRLYLKFH